MQKVKRTAIQEIGVDPVHIQNQSFQVKGNTSVRSVRENSERWLPDNGLHTYYPAFD